MTTQLARYQEALRLLGERRLSSLTEARDARYHLDDAYDDALEYCLEQGLWNFAMRAVQFDADTTAPEFGFNYQFTKPDDWVRSYLMSADERFDRLLLGYELMDEAGYWYSNFNPLYVKYVSDDADYGAQLGLWPQTFSFFFSARLAVQVAPTIANISDTKMEELRKTETKARADARSKDAMNEGPVFPPPGAWASARRGGARSRAVADFGRIG